MSLKIQMKNSSVLWGFKSIAKFTRLRDQILQVLSILLWYSI